MFPQKATQLFSTLITMFPEQQISISEWFLKDHVALKKPDNCHILVKYKFLSF